VGSRHCVIIGNRNIGAAIEMPVSPTHQKIYAVVLNWNNAADTSECVSSLLCTTYPELEIIIVDNASTDGSEKILRERFPDLTFLRAKRNLGYAGGNNIGIRYALKHQADWVLILNSDAVVHEKAIEYLIAAARDLPDVGILAPKVLFYHDPERIQFAGNTRKKWSIFEHPGSGMLDQDVRADEIKETDWALGCSMMVRSDVFHRAGLFDERFFLYMEEAEFCYRAKRKGYRIYFVPLARVWHKDGATFVKEHGSTSDPRRLYFNTRNNLLWIECSLSMGEKIGAYFNFSRYPLGNLRLLLKSRRNSDEWRASRAVLKGAIDYILRRFGDAPQWI
jgi:GT2 family glycosyltransferase